MEGNAASAAIDSLLSIGRPLPTIPIRQRASIVIREDQYQLGASDFQEVFLNSKGFGVGGPGRLLYINRGPNSPYPSPLLPEKSRI